MRHVATQWFLEWNGVALNLYVARKSGMAPYQCVTSKKSSRSAATFCEKVLFMLLKTERRKMGKDEPRLKEGLWLCIRMRSDEALIGTANGGVKARAIRRLPKSQRWGVGLINSLRGSPRRSAPGVLSAHRRASITPCLHESVKTTRRQQRQHWRESM